MQFQIENIKEDILRIDEFGLGTMYIVLGKDRNALIDTGTGVGHIREVMENISQNKAYFVICTHGHVDHVGGMNQFDEVYLHPSDHQMALQVNMAARQDYAGRILEAYSDSPFKIEDVCDYHHQAKLLPMSEGQAFDLGDKQLEVISVPGHTPGSVCLLDREDSVLFSGDNIQHLELLAMPGDNRMDVLKAWLNGLEKVKALRNHFDMLLGGHEPLELAVLDQLYECGTGILNGTLTPAWQHIHIFENEFTSYQNVNICLSEHL